MSEMDHEGMTEIKAIEILGSQVPVANNKPLLRRPLREDPAGIVWGNHPDYERAKGYLERVEQERAGQRLPLYELESRLAKLSEANSHLSAVNEKQKEAIKYLSERLERYMDISKHECFGFCPDHAALKLADEMGEK